MQIYSNIARINQLDLHQNYQIFPKATIRNIAEHKTFPPSSLSPAPAPPSFLGGYFLCQVHGGYGIQLNCALNFGCFTTTLGLLSFSTLQQMQVSINRREFLLLPVTALVILKKNQRDHLTPTVKECSMGKKKKSKDLCLSSEQNTLEYGTLAVVC